MTFQINALPADLFEDLFELDDGELAARNAQRQTVSAKPGTPCRVSLRDADIGETVILVNFEHLPAASPYRSRHGVFVRENAKQAKIERDTVPEVIRSRLVSLRYFDQDHMMIMADVTAGENTAKHITEAFENADIAYAHIHFAKPGCFAASVQRAG